MTLDTFEVQVEHVFVPQNWAAFDDLDKAFAAVVDAVDGAGAVDAIDGAVENDYAA